MRKIVVLALVVLGCQPQATEKTSTPKAVEKPKEVSSDPFQLSIDSAYLLNSYQGKKIQLDSPNYATIDNESIFSLIKTKAIYQVVDSTSINANINAKIIYSNFEHFNLDGQLNLIFIATFNSQNNQIDLLRIGKIEGASDYIATEFSEIQNLEIRKRTEFLGVELDTAWTENYQIDQTGRITKR